MILTLSTTRVQHRQKPLLMPMCKVYRTKSRKNCTKYFSEKKKRKRFQRHGSSRDFISPSVQISALDSCKTMVVHVARLLSYKHSCWTSFYFMRKSANGKIPATRIAQLHFDTLCVRMFELKISRSSHSPKEKKLQNTATILWQAGTNRGQCVVATEKTAGKMKRVSERLVLKTCRTRKDLETYLEVESVWKQFTGSHGRGVILLIYSAVLSRGLRETRDDMASVLGETPQMMGRHDYASQELVNLLLVGGAFSQVFDGEKRLEGQREEDTVLLRGIPKRARVGFLTLFEHYGYVEVGKRLKSPIVPIWVVCSESHYSVLFSAADDSNRHDDDKEILRLFYYDQLANQDETIHLTVHLNAGVKDEFKHGENDEEDLSGKVVYGCVLCDCDEFLADPHNNNLCAACGHDEAEHTIEYELYYDDELDDKTREEAKISQLIERTMDRG